MLAKISLESLEFYTFHGYYEEERIKGNDFVVDVSFYTEVENAANSDNINGTVNYEIIYELVKKEMEIPSKLLEHIANRILISIKNQFPLIEKLELKISKKNPPIKGKAERVSVTLFG